MLSLLHVVPSYYPAVRYGGPIHSVRGLVAGLAARGHRVTVLTTDRDGPGRLDVPLEQPVPMDGADIWYFPCRHLERLAWAPALAGVARRLVPDADVVHLHSVFQWPTSAAARQAERAGVPYLVAPRGMLVADLIRRKNPLVKRAWIRLVERRTLARAAGLHVTAPAEATEARALGLALPEAFCVPNGLDLPNAVPPRAGVLADLPRPYALFLSRINWKKGLDRLVRAWRDVPGLPLVIAGNDEEGYQPTIEALARSEGVADRVHFVGPVQGAAKWALYRDAEVFVLPSYSENFGNVVLESLAMGCPVVLTPEVGLAPAVAEAGAGVVVPGDPAAIAAAVRGLLADPDRRARLGEAGRALVASRYTWPAVVAQMERVYERVLAARGPRLGTAGLPAGAGR